MIPKLFASTATAFTTQGIGALTDTILCYVDEERNGKYEGYLKYPITGIHYADIGMRSIIVCKPNYTDDPQPFRVYEISKPINGVVTVYFQHISYDLSGYPCQPFTASTLTAALSGLTANCPITCPFTLTSSRSVTATFTADLPASIRSWLGGKAGSLLDVYGGEWSYNGFTATLHTQRGTNRGVTIRYGKNLTSLEQEENCSKVYTGVYPYWTDSYGENLTQITGRIVHNTDTDTYAGATYDYDKILPLDLSNKWETQPNETQLINAAKKYIEDNELGTPAVNLDVEFAQISNLIKDRVDLCDTVTVQFERLGVSATAKCIHTRWNVLLDRYEEITLGDAKTTIAETIVGTKETAERAVSKSSLETAVDQATSLITGNSGGYVVLHDSDGDDKPDELLIMNTPSIDTATKVWRWNQSGLGYSSTGYSGTYGLAMTANGQIVADYVNTGTLNANVIKAGVLQDEAGLNSWDMETGALNLNVSGTVQSITTYYAESVDNAAPQWDYPKAYLYDSDNKALYDADGKRLVAKQIWTTTVPTSTSSFYRWMRNYIVYKDGTTELTSAVPLQDYYGRANLVMRASTDSDGNPIGIMSGLADYMKFTTGQLVISSPQFTLDKEGNATFAGNLSAASGTFKGELQAATGSFSGAVTATSLTLGTNASVPSGKVTGLSPVATSGQYTDLTNTPDLTVYVEQGHQYGQAASATTTGFKVTSAGLLTASNAVIYGSIYATSLTLGTNVTVSSSKVSGLATVATSGSYNDLSNKPTIPSLTGYIYVDGTIGQTPAQGSTGFVVSSAGLLQASNAVIYGSLYSSDGTIGGMTLKSNALYNGTNSMTSTTPGVYLGTGGLRIYGSASNYVNATSAGVLTVKGGSITGATFLSDDGTTQLDNSGLTLRNAATDLTSTSKYEIGYKSSTVALRMYTRASTSDAWDVLSSIDATPNGMIIQNARRVQSQEYVLRKPTDAAGTGWTFAYIDNNNYSNLESTLGNITTLTTGTLQSGRAIVSNLFLNGESGTAVGTVKTATSSVTSLPSGSTTNIASVSLTKGTWVVSAQFSMPVASGDSFRLITSITTTSSDYGYTAAYNNQACVGSAQSAVAVSPTRIIEVTAASQTVYLTANQNSGSSKTLTASRNLIRAVCIA